MFEFLLAAGNLPFTIALGLMVGIGLLEGVTTILGFGLSGFLDGLLPDFDLDLDVDLDADVDIDGPGGAHPEGLDLGEVGAPGALSRVLGWLHVGRVPVLVLLVLFLLGFGVSGLALQSFASETLGRLLPAAIASVGALVVGFGFVRVSGGLLARIIPRDESDAVSEASFIGRVAQVVLGTAESGKPTQARLRDKHGRTHYVMVEPDQEGETFQAGEDLLLVRRAGSVFYAIRAPGGALLEDTE